MGGGAQLTSLKVGLGARSFGGVVERTIKDKKAANTSAEKPFVVASRMMAGQQQKTLRFCGAHGAGSTRLMSWHIVSAMFLDFARANPLFKDCR